MMPTDPVLLTAIAQTIIALAALIASISVPVVLYRGQKRRERLELIRALREMWVSIDAALIHDDRLLRIADEFLDPDSRTLSPDQRAKKWLGYMTLNVVFMDYLCAKHGVHERDAMVSLKAHLSRLLRDPDIFALTQSSAAYEPGFRTLCRTIHDSLPKASTPTTPTSPDASMTAAQPATLVPARAALAHAPDAAPNA